MSYVKSGESGVYRKFISLDLELNRPQTHSDIIQVGYCIFDLDQPAETYLVERRLYIELEPNVELDEFITTLTGIQPQQVEFGSLGAISLESAYYQMVADCREHDVFWNPVQWGAGDSRLIRERLDAGIEWIFGRREIDVKTLFQAWAIANGLGIRAGLAKATNRLGRRFSGRKHDALDDAKNTAEVMRILLKKMSGDK